MSITNILQNLELQAADFVKDIRSLDEVLRHYSAQGRSEKFVLKKFESLNKKYSLNPLVLGRLLTFLQLSNDETLIDQYSLKDIGLSFKTLTNIYKDDVELNIESLFFIYNIEDKEDKARKALLKFKQRIKKKVESFSRKSRKPDKIAT